MILMITFTVVSYRVDCHIVTYQQVVWNHLQRKTDVIYLIYRVSQKIFLYDMGEFRIFGIPIFLFGYYEEDMTYF